MEFDWTSRKISDWRNFVRQVPRPNWLQSLPFARAVRLKDQKATRLALIRSDGEAIGMMALQEIKLGPIHILNLYRGPLWFREKPPEQWLADFALLFNKTYPRRFLRRRRWLPEWADSEFARDVLQKTGFKQEPDNYETIWMDLHQSESALRSNLNGKWRNHLNQGERGNLKLSVDVTGATTALFLAFYQSDKSIKKYRGRGPGFVKEEIAAALFFKDAIILWAYQGTTPIAGILILINGQCATYRIGWTTPAGRKASAHNVLLWEAVKILKARGLGYFDLGGIVPHGAEGVGQFKAGMGGEPYKLPGMYS